MKKKLVRQPRPFLLKYPVVGGQRVYTFFTREEALAEYFKIYKEKETRKFHFPGNPHLYKLAMPTQLELLLHKL